MQPNPFVGIIYHWIGGLASATNFIPFRYIRRWSWEIYWIVQGIAAWLIAPLLFASLLVPHLFTILHNAPHSALGYAVLWGAMWGVGGLTFGLSVRYLGIALGYAISLGLCTAFGTLIPPMYTGQIHVLLHERSGQVILIGVLICLIAVAVNGLAGSLKEREVSTEQKAQSGERDFSLSRGVAVAVFAGIMSSFFAFGLQAGEPIAILARAQLLGASRSEIWQNLPVLIVVLWGGFTTNLVWTFFLIVSNRSAAQFAGASGRNPMRAVATQGNTLQDFNPLHPEASLRLSAHTLVSNYLFAALAGLLWYLQFFFYSLGETKMGRYQFASWTLHMASIIIFATLWGIALKEWIGTSRRAKLVLALGLALLVSSTLVVGYGSYLKASEPSLPAVAN